MWTKEGTYYEADPRHAQIIVKEVGKVALQKVPVTNEQAKSKIENKKKRIHVRIH